MIHRAKIPNFVGGFDGETAISIRSANSLRDHEPIQSQQAKGGGDELVASITQEDYIVMDDVARALDLFVKCVKGTKSPEIKAKDCELLSC